MRGALDRARPMLSVEEFAKELELEAPFGDEGVVGLPRDRYARTWSCCFRSLKGFLAPGVAQPARLNFLSATGQRVRKPGPSDMQERVILFWGTGHRNLLEKVRGDEPAAAECVRERDSASQERPSDRRRSPTIAPWA